MSHDLSEDGIQISPARRIQVLIFYAAVRESIEAAVYRASPLGCVGIFLMGLAVIAVLVILLFKT